MRSECSAATYGDAADDRRGDNAMFRRMWRNTLNQFVSKEEHDIGAIRQRLTAIDDQIAAQERALAAISVDEVLADSDSGNEIVAKLAGLRARRDVLLAAEVVALAAEHQRVTEAQAKEIASKRRAAVQHLARMERHFAELVEHAAQAQAAFAKAAEARQAAELLLPPRGSGGYAPVHDDLSYHRLRNLARLAAYREGVGSLYPVAERGDVVGAGAYEDSQGALRSMQDVLGEIIAQAKQALQPTPTLSSHQPPAGDEVVCPEPDAVSSSLLAPGEGETEPAREAAE
jgi:hypothetical protein